MQAAHTSCSFYDQNFWFFVFSFKISFLQCACVIFSSEHFFHFRYLLSQFNCFPLHSCRKLSFCRENAVSHGFLISSLGTNDNCVEIHPVVYISQECPHAHLSQSTTPILLQLILQQIEVWKCNKPIFHHGKAGELNCRGQCVELKMENLTRRPKSINCATV